MLNLAKLIFIIGFHDEKTNGYGGGSGYSGQKMQPMQSKPVSGGAAMGATAAGYGAGAAYGASAAGSDRYDKNFS